MAVVLSQSAPSWRDARRTVALGLLVASLCACGTSAESDGASSAPYSDEVDAAARSATSAFEKQVLDDGAVTRAEYDEAVQLFVSCLADLGVEVATIETGGYYTYSVAGDATAYDANVDQCAEGTTAEIEPLYVATVTNPTDTDYWELTAQCLATAGVAPEGYTGEELQRDRESGIEAVLDTSDPNYSRCMSNPSE